jgi:hypothetical protein
MAPHKSLALPGTLLGNECFPNRCSCPSVRAVNRWNLPPVQLVGDVVERQPLSEHRVDPRPPLVVTSVAEPMREPDVVGGEVASVHLEPRIVVGRRLPIGIRPSRLEVPTAPDAVALGHLAAHLDDLPIPGKLPEDSADPPGRELLNRRFFRARKHAPECRTARKHIRVTLLPLARCSSVPVSDRSTGCATVDAWLREWSAPVWTTHRSVRFHF